MDVAEGGAAYEEAASLGLAESQTAGRRAQLGSDGSALFSADA